MNFNVPTHWSEEKNLEGLLVDRRRIGAGARAPVVLVPVDGSIASDNAVRYVARNLRDGWARVHLLNVQRPILPDPALLHAANAIVASHREAADRILGDAADVLSRHGVEHSQQVSFGAVAETIARIAEERATALVVMGTRGRHPIVNLVANSVPTKVAAITRVPVLLVRPSGEGKDDALRVTAPTRAVA